LSEHLCNDKRVSGGICEEKNAKKFTAQLNETLEADATKERNARFDCDFSGRSRGAIRGVFWNFCGD
jgi:hypothetical protein